MAKIKKKKGKREKLALSVHEYPIEFNNSQFLFRELKSSVNNASGLFSFNITNGKLLTRPGPS